MNTIKNIIIIIIGLILLIQWASFELFQRKVYDVGTNNCGGLEKLQWVSFSPFTHSYGFGCMPK